jgi:hypothetical protein
MAHRLVLTAAPAPCALGARAEHELAIRREALRERASIVARSPFMNRHERSPDEVFAPAYDARVGLLLEPLADATENAATPPEAR